jgi:hypothetical protein
MQTKVSSSLYAGILRNPSDEKQEYVTTLKKDVFKKFFHVLKNSGQAKLRINNQALMEMEFSYDKCAYITVVLETASRSI